MKPRYEAIYMNRYSHRIILLSPFREHNYHVFTYMEENEYEGPFKICEQALIDWEFIGVL